ncbi:hypothetical protein [Bacillus cereus group sp. IBL03679]|uniref:hypothetical protein n=1 Tax=Bacillus cereus group sp. IBL03679 TaxID=3240095 RepID=UPI003D2F8B28
MRRYKKRIESLEELHKVMEALDVLEKTYVITKEMEQKTTAITKEEYSVVSWRVEEVDTFKDFCDGEEIVKLVCNDCGTSFTGKRILVEGKGCIHSVTHNTTIVPLDKESECK